ncbi:hypothetical protein M011DRAFT_402219 [Sporormia fimetaria CBS 119925]|uniref:Uncharacterized protein n=1 Tax=Sporormia fimetaria CBS 119925 TaxID=1340428 RepID=A0A6A6VA91_9PLEO|nr:hypothetical protein M011DRAFT_402219 [Sporormia fimetaria CBS 119925]
MPEAVPFNGARVNTNKAAQHAGYNNFKHLLESYGLRIWEIDDVEEGKAILRGMGYNVD